MLSHLSMIIVVRNSSCGKVMLSHACVKNSVHRGGSVCLRGHPPWADQTPPSCAETLWADTAWADTPPGPTLPPGQIPPSGKKPPRQTPLPPRQPLQRTVRRILLGCILVPLLFFNVHICRYFFAIEQTQKISLLLIIKIYITNQENLRKSNLSTP